MRHLFHIMLMLFFFFATLTVFPGYGEKGRAYTVIDHADSLMDGKADSALRFLNSHEEEVSTWPMAERMRFHLLQIKAQNKADSNGNPKYKIYYYNGKKH